MGGFRQEAPLAMLLDKVRGQGTMKLKVDRFLVAESRRAPRCYATVREELKLRASRLRRTVANRRELQTLASIGPSALKRFIARAAETATKSLRRCWSTSGT